MAARRRLPCDAEATAAALDAKASLKAPAQQGAQRAHEGGVDMEDNNHLRRAAGSREGAGDAKAAALALDAPPAGASFGGRNNNAGAYMC